MRLEKHDLRYVAQRLPKDIRDLMKTHGHHLMVGGGFLRATIAGEVPNDIDLFGSSAEQLDKIATALMSVRPGSKKHTTKNAITVITPDRLPVQFITRWVFETPFRCLASFDFTVCQALVWRSLTGNGEFNGIVGERFYQDLAARRLHYTSPVREEEAGGSMLRVIKYIKRGYTIQVGSLGAVIARLHVAVRDSALAQERPEMAIAGLLREVDPLLVIDGFEVVDDHEPVEGVEEAANV
jgi:hypothetical protein